MHDSPNPLHLALTPIDNTVAENTKQGFVAAKPERPQTVPPHLPTKAAQVTVFAVSVAPPNQGLRMAKG